MTGEERRSVRRSLESLSVVVVLVAAFTVSGFVFFNAINVPETPTWSDPVMVLSEDLNLTGGGMLYYTNSFGFTIGPSMSQIKVRLDVVSGSARCSIINSTGHEICTSNTSSSNYVSPWTDIVPGNHSVTIGYGQGIIGLLTVLGRGLFSPPPI